MNQRDTRLVQRLGEAYAKEAELEADLTAHISLTQKDSYRKRLEAHLEETHEHKKLVGERITALGGSPSAGPGRSVPGIPSAVGELAGKAVAAVKGQVGTARAVVTNQTETHLRNAQEEFREEHVELAIYHRIETFATEVGDKETAALAKRIIRDEERMAKFLDTEITRLVKELVRSEIPKEERSASSGRGRTATGSTRSASGSRASNGSGSSGRGRSASASSGRTRATSSRSRGATSGSRTTSGSSS